jgi:hypothetical protein
VNHEVLAIAVDWSGRAKGAGKHTVVAEALGGELLWVRSGMSRPELIEYLLKKKEDDSALVVGFDFAFSAPAWFLQHLGVTQASDFWKIVAHRGEQWLRDCEPPFWGRPGKTRPAIPAHLRRTEEAAPPIAGIRPKSFFQIGGAGAVGTASLRGIPLLTALQDGGFSIWPFDEARLPMVVEIYPRLLTGPIRKADPSLRWEYLEGSYPLGDPAMMALASASEDAFDASVSALVMSKHVEDILDMPPPDDPAAMSEGWIWWPEDEVREGVVLRDELSPLVYVLVPDDLHFYVGGYGSTEHSVDLEGEEVVYRATTGQEVETIRSRPSVHRWRRFYEQVYRVGAPQWPERFDAGEVVDGTHWEFHLRPVMTASSGGASAYPPDNAPDPTPEFNMLCRAISYLVGPPEIS